MSVYPLPHDSPIPLSCPKRDPGCKHTLGSGKKRQLKNVCFLFHVADKAFLKTWWCICCAIWCQRNRNWAGTPSSLLCMKPAACSPRSGTRVFSGFRLSFRAHWKLQGVLCGKRRNLQYTLFSGASCTASWVVATYLVVFVWSETEAC